MKLAILALALAPLAVAAQDSAAPGALFEDGVEAYRAGDYGRAHQLWEGLLAEPLSEDDRARVLYGLGNAAYRLGEPLEAAGWYTAALRYAPRDGDARENLELARREADLEPADPGTLSSAFWFLLTALTFGESARLALGGLLFLLAVLLAEAGLGGGLWRALSGVALILAAVCFVPWIAHALQDGGETVWTVEEGGAELRAEPHRELEVIGRLAPGEIAHRIDALPGWVRVRTDDGERGWVAAGSVLEHDPPPRGVERAGSPGLDAVR